MNNFGSILHYSKREIKTKFLIVFIFTLTTSSSLGQTVIVNKNNWPGETEYDFGTLGYELLRIFKTHCQACKIDAVSKRFNKVPEKKRNYIPSNLTSQISIRSFSLNEKQYQYISSASSGLMLNAFTKNESESKELIFDDEIGIQRKFNVSFNSLPKNFIAAQDDRPNFLLRANCAAYIEAAAKAKIGIPVGNFESALDANSKSESSVVLIYGWIKSPLFQYLSNSETQLQAYQDIWNFYYDKINFINNAFFIEEFYGLQVKHLQGQEQNVEFDSKLDIKGGTGIFFGKLSTSGGLIKSSIYTQTNWETYLIQNDDKTNVKWKKLPDLIEIKNKIEKDISKSIKSINEFNVATKGEFTHFAILKGIDQNLCGISTTNWELKLDSKGGIYKNNFAEITNVEYDHLEKTCICKINGYLEEELFLDLTSPLVINYTLVNKKIIKTNNGSYEELSFNFSNSFTRSNHPTARTNSQMINYGTKPSPAGQNFSEIFWEIPIYFIDQNKPVDFSIGKKAIINIDKDNPSFSSLGSDESISILNFRAELDEMNNNIYMLRFKLNEPKLLSKSIGNKIVPTRINFNVPIKNTAENANITLNFNLILPQIIKEESADKDENNSFEIDLRNNN
jgi:hypothetical protein